MQVKDLFDIGLSFFNDVRGRLRGATADSLIEYTRVGRVEPMTLIDSRAMDVPEIGDIQQTMLAVFSGYYLQAASLINQIGNVRVLDRLESLNPNRSPVQNVLDGNAWFLNMQSYEGGLPFVSEGVKLKPNAVRLAMEGRPAELSMEANDKKTPPPPWKPNSNSPVPGHLQTNPQYSMSRVELNKAITELANLSVGKLYEIEVTDGQRKFNTSVNIRLAAQMVTPTNLIHILTTGREDTGAVERAHGYWSGKLGFWKDIIFANDLIDKHRRDLMKDTSGVLSNIERNQLNNNLSTIISGNPSIASASGIVVMHQDTADELELNLEGRLAKFDVRQRLMMKTSVMIMAVVDTDNGWLTIYHRSIALPTQVRLKDLKASNKGNGPDVSDILKAYMAGSAPHL